MFPPPRVHQTHYHGVFASNASGGSRIVPAPVTPPAAPAPPEPAPPPTSLRPRRLDWAALLLRVYSVDVLSCLRCGSKLARHCLPRRREVRGPQARRLLPR